MLGALGRPWSPLWVPKSNLGEAWSPKWDTKAQLFWVSGAPKACQSAPKTPKRLIFWRFWSPEGPFFIKSEPMITYLCEKSASEHPEPRKPETNETKNVPETLIGRHQKTECLTNFDDVGPPKGHFFVQQMNRWSLIFVKNLWQNTRNHGNPKRLKRTVNAPETLIVEGRRQWR